MAKVFMAGNAVVFESSMKLEDLIQIKKYRPDALCVKGGEDGKELLFVATVNPGSMGDLCSDGIVFGQASHDGKGLATITMVMENVPDTTEELKNVLADKLGAPLSYMTQLEKTLPDVLKEVEKERAAVMEAITIG